MRIAKLFLIYRYVHVELDLQETLSNTVLYNKYNVSFKPLIGIKIHNYLKNYSY